ncbi:MAG: hypothetical protein MJY54_02795 [archaeon]|nr:hypothetical protein [archaeon]
MTTAEKIRWKLAVAKEIKFLLATTKQIAESVTIAYIDQKKDPLVQYFWNIWNRVKIAEEIMTFYERYWRSPGFSAASRNSMSELTKDLFIDLVSMVEKAMKDYIKTNAIFEAEKEESLKTGNHLLIRNIIDHSTQRNILDQDTSKEWNSILTIRNIIIHNNSMSDRCRKFTVAGINISMRPKKIMKGPSNTFIVLSSRVIELFHSWIKKINGRL